jgi:ubiquitin-conjugating enzyme E2 variant
MSQVADRNQGRIGGGYSSTQRAVETACLVLFVLAELVTLGRAARAAPAWWMLTMAPAAMVCAAMFADLVSGVVHWGCDTWGAVDTPVLGKAFIRQFREHHVDPEEINHHDLVEANGTNGGLSLLPIGVAWLLPYDVAHPTPLAWGTQLGVAVFAFLVTFTSQAHQWAHAKRVPGWVAWCQRKGIMLSREHHDVHHVAPHLHNYCITGGWMDAVIERFQLFRRAERLITRVTGTEPRAGQ